MRIVLDDGQSICNCNDGSEVSTSIDTSSGSKALTPVPLANTVNVSPLSVEYERTHGSELELAVIVKTTLSRSVSYHGSTLCCHLKYLSDICPAHLK